MMFTRTDPKVARLRTIDVLSGLPHAELTAIGRLTTAVDLAAGEVLCVQGSPGDQVFAVLTGQVAVSRDNEAVAILNGGELVGEMAVLHRSSRVASAVALVDVTAMVMSVLEFERLLVEHPSVAVRIRSLAEARRQQLAA